ncbi:hypothetical protein LOK49_LG02G01128 [Camellia lanceoleosa]|uniref:Uncharacterized protein n=1 Tax=Camellia lanceoleosa TaxID=1840588 RepID=A0ACC0IP68_9ERIC|nr:hypothetical protein LOK49_LG02G01128 [Camellia lanceoleosa]
MPCIRICKIVHRTTLETLRKIWDVWDLRVLAICILFTQLYLHIFGQRRRKSTAGLMNDVGVWLLYLLADLLATIALGKDSKLNADASDINSTNLLRGLWASIIFFFLGGPDTLTILRLEETSMWLKQLVGLLTQGVRTSVIMIVTWNIRVNKLSILALLMFFSGLIKYGERVWVIKSGSKQKYEGFVELDVSKIRNSIAHEHRPNVKLVLQAYSYFRTFIPSNVHNKPRDELIRDELIREFREWVLERGTTHNTFKLIEIELGLMYDILFSKVGTVFTFYGSILRLISFSCIAFVLVAFYFFKKPSELLEGDVPITICLIVGALVLEIAGVLAQLCSDWAIVWAFKYYPSKLVMPVFHLHEFVFSKSKRWSELMGQFSLLNYCTKNKHKMFYNVVETVWDREIVLMNFSLPLSPIQPSLKELIINQLRNKLKRNVPEAETFEASNRKIGEWALTNYGHLDAFKWIIELEFDESIVIWHVATDVCYHLELEDPKFVTDEVETTKILSYYMMHLLLICPSLPICDDIDTFDEAYTDVKKFFDERDSGSSTVKPYKLFLEKEWSTNNLTMNKIQKLVCGLMEKENKWNILSNVWVEMLCYAASRCLLKHHAQELRSGGQFVTHVWLLLVHLGEIKKLEKDTSEESMDEIDSAYEAKGFFVTLANVFRDCLS